MKVPESIKTAGMHLADKIQHPTPETLKITKIALGALALITTIALIATFVPAVPAVALFGLAATLVAVGGLYVYMKCRLVASDPKFRDLYAHTPPSIPVPPRTPPGMEIPVEPRSRTTRPSAAELQAGAGRLRKATPQPETPAAPKTQANLMAELRKRQAERAAQKEA